MLDVRNATTTFVGQSCSKISTEIMVKKCEHVRKLVPEINNKSSMKGLKILETSQMTTRLLSCSIATILRALF